MTDITAQDIINELEKPKVITVDTILESLTSWVESRTPINPELWIDAGLKMNLLKEPLTARIIALQQSLAKKRVMLLEDGKSVAYAKTIIEADDEYSECRTLEAKIKLIEEQIRLAKVRGKMGLDDYNSH